MARVKTGIRRLSAPQLVAYAQSIHDQLQGNPAFANPTPALPVLQTAINELMEANAIVEANGGKMDHQRKRSAFEVLKENIRLMASYVQLASAGNESTILTSGFEVIKHGTPAGEVGPPQELGAKLSNTSGRVALRWKHDPLARMHHVYMSRTAEPFEWELIGVTTKSRFDIDRLEPGTFYWFSVAAIGTAGASSRSDVLRAMAA